MNEKEMERLFRANYLKMYRLAQSILYDEDESRDVVSEVLEEVFRSQRLLLRSETTEAYLLRSVRNRCRNRISNLAMRQRVGRLYALELDTAETDAELENERMDQVLRFLETEVKPLTRRIVEMRFRQEMSYEEIARQTGVSRVTVYHHLAKTIDTLRCRLAKKKVNSKHSIK